MSAKDFLQLAYDAVKDKWDLPDINYLKSLDGSESSRDILENVSKEAAQRLLSHFATIASSKLLENLLGKLENLTLPDLNGKSKAMVAEVDYETSNNKVSRSSRPNSQVSIQNGNITWNVSELGVQSVGDWIYKMAGGLLTDKGNYELSMNDIGFQLSANIIKTLEGAFDLKLGECFLNRGTPDLQFGGSPGCLLFQCLFENAIKNKLSEMLPQQMSDVIKEIVEQVSPLLFQFNGYWPVAMGIREATSDLFDNIRKGF